MEMKNNLQKLQQHIPVPFGMRTFKTAIAATLTALLALTPVIGNRFYALMGTILGMQTTVSQSFNVGIGRILGTAIGAFVGFVFGSLGFDSPLAIGIAVAIVIMICVKLNILHSTLITITLCLLIMFNPDREGGLFNYALFRTLDTAAGVVVGFLVNRFFAPPNHLKYLIKKLELFYELSLTAERDEDILYKLKSEIQNFQVLHNNYLADIKYDKHDLSKVNLFKTVEASNDLYFHFKNAKNPDDTVSNYHKLKINEALEMLKQTLDELKGVL